MYVHELISLYMQRWYVCGDVECFKGYHLPLALLAIITLAFCVLIIPVTAAIALKKVGSRDA